jgi:hypothetical protein
MLPRDKTSLLKRTIVRITGLPDAGSISCNASDTRFERRWDVVTDLED